MAELDASGSMAAEVSAGRLFTSGGQSHSCDRPTRQLSVAIAVMSSVPAGSRDIVFGYLAGFFIEQTAWLVRRLENQFYDNRVREESRGVKKLVTNSA
jgi:hypothetical protein